MLSPLAGRLVFVCLVAAVLALTLDAPVAGQGTPRAFKVAYYNIKGRLRQIGLSGSPVVFAETSNCTDRSRPLNVFGGTTLHCGQLPFNSPLQMYRQAGDLDGSPAWSALLAERALASPARRLTPSLEATYQPDSPR